MIFDCICDIQLHLLHFTLYSESYLHTYVYIYLDKWILSWWITKSHKWEIDYWVLLELGSYISIGKWCIAPLIWWSLALLFGKIVDVWTPWVDGHVWSESFLSWTPIKALLTPLARDLLAHLRSATYFLSHPKIRKNRLDSLCLAPTVARADDDGGQSFNKECVADEEWI